jgi:hypothetical protein
LVTGQNTASQNGLYFVSSVGTGANGTWLRTSDGNENGEVQAGMIVMVTEGSLYHDTQWKLTTDNPIVIGTTALTFVINILSQIGGSNTQIQYNNAGTMGGSANLTWDGTTLYTNGAVSVTGNITGNYILGNGSQLSGIITTVDANTLTGNTLSSNVVTSSLTSVGTLGSLSVTANTTSGNLLTGGLISATGNITGGNANIIGTTASTSKTTGALKVAGGIGVAGDVYAGNSVTVDGGAYGNVTTTAFASVWGSGAGPNPYSIMQVRASDGVSGIGMQAYTGSGTLYGNTNIIFALGQVRDKDVPASLVTKAYIDSTGFSVTGIANVSGNVTGGNVLTAGLISATGAITVGGDISLTGNIVDAAAMIISTSSNGNITLSPNGTGVVIVNKDIQNGQGNGTGNIGSATTYFNTVFAKATSAQYADLAENYEADADYTPGTVVVFGGNKEITVTNNSHNTAVAGVISTNPSYLMNAGQSGEWILPVALTGRVPCRVQGPVNKGTVLVTGDIPGTAMAIDTSKFKPGCVVGKSLEIINSTDVLTIEVAVGRL